MCHNGVSHDNRFLIQNGAVAFLKLAIGSAMRSEIWLVLDGRRGEMELMPGCAETVESDEASY